MVLPLLEDEVEMERRLHGLNHALKNRSRSEDS